MGHGQTAAAPYGSFRRLRSHSSPAETQLANKCFMSNLISLFLDVMVQRWIWYTEKTAFLIEDLKRKTKEPVAYADLDSFRGETTGVEFNDTAQTMLVRQGCIQKRQNANGEAIFPMRARILFMDCAFEYIKAKTTTPGRLIAIFKQSITCHWQILAKPSMCVNCSGTGAEIGKATSTSAGDDLATRRDWQSYAQMP